MTTSLWRREAASN